MPGELGIQDRWRHIVTPAVRHINVPTAQFVAATHTATEGNDAVREVLGSEAVWTDQMPGNGVERFGCCL